VRLPEIMSPAFIQCLPPIRQSQFEHGSEIARAGGDAVMLQCSVRVA
jgi:hypothetical protein